MSRLFWMGVFILALQSHGILAEGDNLASDGGHLGLGTTTPADHPEALPPNLPVPEGFVFPHPATAPQWVWAKSPDGKYEGYLDTSVKPKPLWVYGGGKFLVQAPDHSLSPNLQFSILPALMKKKDVSFTLGKPYTLDIGEGMAWGSGGPFLPEGKRNRIYYLGEPLVQKKLLPAGTVIHLTSIPDVKDRNHHGGRYSVLVREAKFDATIQVPHEKAMHVEFSVASPHTNFAESPDEKDWNRNPKLSDLEWPGVTWNAEAYPAGHAPVK